MICLYLSKNQIKTISNPTNQVSVIRGTVSITLSVVKPTNSSAETVKPADTLIPPVYDSDVEFKNKASKIEIYYNLLN